MNSAQHDPRPIQAINELRIRGSADVFVKRGEPSMTVIAEKPDDVITEVRSGVLTISQKPTVIAGRQHEQETAKEVGQWVAYALLRGDALAAVLAFGRDAALYDSAISRLARRIADAMRFLAEDKNATELHGRAITTMMDMFRLSRNLRDRQRVSEV